LGICFVDVCKHDSCGSFNGVCKTYVPANPATYTIDALAYALKVRVQFVSEATKPGDDSRQEKDTKEAVAEDLPAPVTSAKPEMFIVLRLQDKKKID